MTHQFLLTDQVGSLRAVADTTGAIVKRIDYDSFGNIIADSNPSFSVPFGFAGGLHDRDTGLVRFGARDYSPELGRFVAKDPIDFSGGDTNLYAYSMSNPVSFVDPDGLRVINSSGRTIPVVINERLPGGKQGPQEILYLPPGGDTEKIKPGWDTDGIYPAGDSTRVLKIVDGLIAEVLPGGGVRFPWDNRAGDIALQWLFGGWRDEDFLEKWKWPRPASCGGW